MRWLVTGAGGMLGADLRVVLADEEATFATRADLDVTDLEAVSQAVLDADIVINAAAYTAVDDAEEDVAAATAVNATGAENLAVAAESFGATFIQISTDYVFDGTATTPYPEDAPVSPLSVYGRTKADGERLALAANPATIILRTAWLYGEHGANFVSAILGRAHTTDRVEVLTDQNGQPTWTMDLAERIRAVGQRRVPGGIYHATNSGSASRFEFAQEIFRLAGLDPARVVPATGGVPRPAPRPAYSVLGGEGWASTGLQPLRDWRAALGDAAARGVLAALD